MPNEPHEPHEPQHAAAVVITPDPLHLTSGDTLTLSAVVLDSAGEVIEGALITWSRRAQFTASEKPDPFSLSESGLVTAFRSGTADSLQGKVIATSESVSDTSLVMVAPLPVSIVEIDTTDLYLTVGLKKQLHATARSSSGGALSGRLFEWNTSDSAIAKVSASGEVTGVAPGSALVSATSEGRSDTIPVTVGNVLVSILRPLPTQRVSDTVMVRAVISSKFQLKTITAVLGGSSIAMTQQSHWIAALPIKGETFGEQELHVTASDAFGSSHTVTVPVVYDPLPVLSISEPANNVVGNPFITIKASCTDGNAMACMSIAANLEYGNQPVLAFGTTVLDTIVSLASFHAETRPLQLIFTGVDSSGQTVHTSRPVYPPPGNNLQLLAEVPGEALDYDGDRVLYRVDMGPGHQVLRLLTIGGSDVFIAEATTQPVSGYLVPGGVFYRGDLHGLSEYRNGTITVLGASWYLVVEGTFGVWGTLDLVLRDFATGQTKIIATGVANADVSGNGDVVYSTVDGKIVSLPRGALPDTVSEGPDRHQSPKTDGSIVVYRNVVSYPKTQQLYMVTPPGQQVPLSVPGPTPDPFSASVVNMEYEVAGGWVAYEQQDLTRKKQVWILGPGDVRTQVTFFGGGAMLEGLNDRGEVVVRSGDTRYLSVPPYTTLVPISNLTGVVKVRDGRFILLLSGSIFLVP